MKKAALEVLWSVLGLRCWQVRWDSHMGLDMNFGMPRYADRELPKSKAHSPRVRALLARPSSFLRGTHYLLISAGTWHLTLGDGMSVSDTSSAKDLDMAVARLVGQKVEGLSISASTGITTFHFDLGARIVVRARSTSLTDADLWSLDDDTNVVDVSAGGDYWYGSVERPPGREKSISTRDEDTLIIARTAALRRRIRRTSPPSAVIRPAFLPAPFDCFRSAAIHGPTPA